MAEGEGLGRNRGFYAGVGVTGEQYMFVRNAIIGGMSASAVIREMRGTELSLRDAAVFAIRREVLGIQRSSGVINSTPYNFFPSEAAFTPTAMPLGGRYRVTVRLPVPEEVPGEANFAYATITHDLPMTRLEYVNAAFSILQNTLESRGLADENGNLSVGADDVDFIAAETEL